MHVEFNTFRNIKYIAINFEQSEVCKVSSIRDWYKFACYKR